MNAALPLVHPRSLLPQAGLALLLLTLAACSTTPKPPADPTGIPDAIPREEPPSATGNPESYVVFGRRYYVDGSSEGFRQSGVASWYGTDFHGKKTSSGEPYDMYAMTAAHKTLPIPTYVRVVNRSNGRSAVVRVNDRGPFVNDRIIDLSLVAARKLGLAEAGTGQVEIEALPPYQSIPALAQRRRSAPEVYAVADDNSSPLAPMPLVASPIERTPPPAVERPRRSASPVARAAGGSWQVGAFGEAANAEALRQRLADQLDSPVQVVREAGLHKVRVGPLSDDEASQVRARLQGLGLGQPAWIAP